MLDMKFRQRWEAWLPEMLRAVVWEGSEQRARYAVYAARLIRQLALCAAMMMVLCALVWWPLDAVLMPDAAHREAFALMRVWVVGTMTATLGVFAFVRLDLRASQWVGVGFYALLLAGIGAALGELGRLEWLADAYFGLVPSALLPMRLLARLGAVGALSAALGGGFFWTVPAGMDPAAVAAQVSFLAFAAFATAVIGEVWTRITRRTFFKRLELDHANAQLTALTDTLHEQVADRTRELRALARHLSDVQERERRRLARELHDDLGQHLTAMRYTASRLERRVERDGASDDVIDLVEDLAALLEGTHTSLRSVLSGLRPRVLDELGLVPAVEWLCETLEQAGTCAVALDVSETFAERADRLVAEHELVLFRAIQEATTNALKHADGVRLIRVALDMDGDRAVAVVEDDGPGFDPDAETSGFGLLSMREWVRAVGGVCVLDTAPGRGVRLRVELPSEAAPALDDERASWSAPTHAQEGSPPS